MKKYSVLLSKIAVKFLERSDSASSRRIKEHLRLLCDDPFKGRPGADIKQLVGCNPPLFRIRVGDYRALYAVIGNEVRVTEIMRRSAGYEWVD